ncbi:MAG: efflux RND transporter permease subunit, partial [Gammaproteobacteria bacterium]|nr:efflux RND transporter permease subunit [Gammaproteobacteria bacterium]
MSGITAFALNNSRFVILFQITIVLAGIYAFLEYPRREDPSITIREAVVTASFPGMSTLRVEDLITRQLEEKIREIPEVKELKSDSKTGLSIVHVIVKDEYTDLEPIWQDLRNKMDDIRSKLPEGTIGPSVNDEFGLTAVATVALWADGFSMAEMRDVARRTRDRLYEVKGIKKVELFGIQDERIYLELSNAKMASLGMSPGMIFRTLKQQNIILPGGKLNVEGQEIIIEPSGNFNDVSEIRSVLVPIPGTDKVTPLRDLVKISRGYVDPPTSPVYFNGRPAIVLSISIVDGVNSVEFGERLTRKIDQLEGGLPFGYFLDYATYQPELVELAVNGAMSNVYQSLAIVLVVVMVFLGFRTGLIVGSFVPLAMLMGLVIMRIADIELQRMSVAALIIALGMLVDNGIVVAEDIRTRLEAGEDRREAVLASGNTLAIPLLIASLTTILAFAPIPLAVGGTGEYTLSLGQVVIIVLLSSWFLAMFSTTTLCYQFMKVKPRNPDGDEDISDPYATGFYRIYRALLDRMLRLRIATLVVTVAALLGAGYAMKFVVQEFFPSGDRNQFLIYLDLPAGTRVDQTAAEVQKLSAWLGDKKANPEVVTTIAYVGSGGPRFFLSLAPLDPDPHVAFLVVATQDDHQIPAMVERVRGHLADQFPSVRGRVKSMWLGASEPGVLEIRINGPDADVLVEKAELLSKALRRIPGILDLKQDWENRVLKIEVRVDQARARRAKVTSQEVAASLNAYISGMPITDYREGDTTIPLVVRGLESERRHMTLLRNINVYSASTGKNVTLPQVADFHSAWDLSRIKRFDQVRTITVSAKHQYLKAQQIFDRLQPDLENLKLSPDYQWAVGGELEKSKEAKVNLFKNMPVCLLLIVVLLVWQFNSFRRPAIIIVTIPLTFIGAVIGLLVMGAPFSFMVILGLLSLA